MHRMVVAVAVALLAPSFAVADPMFQLGVGVRQTLSEPTMTPTEPESEANTSVGLDAAVAFPLTPTLAVGARGAIATSRTATEMYWGMQHYDEYRHREVPLEGGVLASKRFGRVSVAPWLGLHARRRTTDVRVCGPYGPTMPNNGCSSTFENITMETDWLFRPAAGLGINVDILRASGAMLGAAIHAQYVSDFSSAGIDLTVRL